MANRGGGWSSLFKATVARGDHFPDQHKKRASATNGVLFLELPPDLVASLMRFLTGFDVLRLSMVSHRVYDVQLAGDCAVWQRLAPWDRGADALYATQAKLPSEGLFNKLFAFASQSKRPRPSPPVNARASYACRRSVRFHESLQEGVTVSTRGTAIATSRLADLASQNRSFSIDICFAVSPTCGSSYVNAGGILLGAQDSELSRVHRPEIYEQLIYLDRDRNLYCSVTDDKPIVATTLQHERWYHVVLVYEAASSTQRVYLDNELVHSTTGMLNRHWALLTYAQLGSGWISEAQLTGGTWNRIRWYQIVGLVDDCRFWNGVLDADDVQYLTHGKETAVGVSCVWSMRGHRNDADHGMVSLIRCTRPTEQLIAELATTELLPMKHSKVRVTK